MHWLKNGGTPLLCVSRRQATVAAIVLETIFIGGKKNVPITVVLYKDNTALVIKLEATKEIN